MDSFTLVSENLKADSNSHSLATHTRAGAIFFLFTLFLIPLERHLNILINDILLTYTMTQQMPHLFLCEHNFPGDKKTADKVSDKGERLRFGSSPQNFRMSDC
jgi:hypothetical protein